jgi:hypothetical protein
VLWKPATETPAWKMLTAISCRVCIPSARIRFVDPFGDHGPGPTFFAGAFSGVRPEKFEEAFAGMGAGYFLIMRDGFTIGPGAVEKKE